LPHTEFVVHVLFYLHKGFTFSLDQWILLVLVSYGELPQFPTPKLENYPCWLFAVFCNIFRTTLHLWTIFYSISSQSRNLVTWDTHNN